MRVSTAAAALLAAGLFLAAGGCSLGTAAPVRETASAGRQEGPPAAPGEAMAQVATAAAVPTSTPAAASTGDVLLAAAAPPSATAAPTSTPVNLAVPAGASEDPSDRRTIAGLRARAYEGEAIEIVRTLATTSLFTSYLIAYRSDGIRVTGFLNVPRGNGPFPVLLINHGYINPAGYVPVASNYVKREGDYLASRGYLTAGSDYRGHGSAVELAVGSHLEPAYVIDVLNLLAALKTFPQADTSRIGVWGHSNGGSISERVMVVSKDVRATVIWAGVSADAVDAWLYYRDWLRRPEAELRARFGHPDETPDHYSRMSSRAYLADVVGPVQIHHGTADASVPYAHATMLDRRLTDAGRPHELYTYPGAPHNWFGPTWDQAMARTLTFFNTHVGG